MSSLTKFQKDIDYSFADPQLLMLALTHRSAGRVNNERLEFLGDGLLGFVVADELFSAFPDINEGQLSQSRSRLVNKHALASHARQLRLGEYLRLGPGELKSGGFDRDSILEDGFEALIGAIYLDGGIDAARSFIVRLVRPLIEQLEPGHIVKDPKTSLQEYLATKSISHPDYQIIDTSGPPHNRRFKVRCSIPQTDVSSEGVGKSVRSAEQDAAAAARLIIEAQE